MKTRMTLEGFECLEEKLLLAGDVAGAVVGETLRLTGDGRDNWFEIQQLTTTSFLVKGLESAVPPGEEPAPTTINGAAAEVFVGVTNFKVIGNGGEEYIFFNGDTGQGAPGPMIIRGFVIVKGNNGSDNILFDGVTIKGTTIVNGNDGGDTIQFIDGRAKDRFTIIGEGQGDTIALLESVFEAPTKVNAGDGPDRVFLGFQQGALKGSTFRDSLGVNVGNNQNFLESTESTFLGSVLFRSGNQKDDVDINDSDFRGLTRILTADGRDLVEINDSVFRASASQFKLLTGDRRDIVKVFDSRFATDVTLLHVGDGNDDLSIFDSFFTGLADGRTFVGGPGNLDSLDAGIFGADNGNVFAGGAGTINDWESAT